MPSADELKRRDEVMQAIRSCIRQDTTIKLPDFDAKVSRPGISALVSVGLEPNPYCGECGDYRYQFEGEEDLLHLIVTRCDGEPLTPEEGQTVAGFVLEGVPPGLVWFRPGDRSQHFFVGHDELLR